MLSNIALKPLAPVFFAIAFFAINLNAFSVKCNLTYSTIKITKEYTQSCRINFHCWANREKSRGSTKRNKTYIIHAEHLLVLFTKSIFWLYEDLCYKSNSIKICQLYDHCQMEKTENLSVINLEFKLPNFNEYYTTSIWNEQGNKIKFNESATLSLQIKRPFIIPHLPLPTPPPNINHNIQRTISKYNMKNERTNLNKLILI